MLRTLLPVLAVAFVATPPAPRFVAGPPPVVVIHAKDFAFVAPKTVKSGVNTIRLVNDGKEMHHVSIFRLDKGKTMVDFAAAMKKPGASPAWMTEVGGPNPALPGTTVEVTLSLMPGSYAIVCFIPSPGSPLPHMMKGMVGEFTVVAAPSGGTEPVVDANAHLSDYTFSLDKPLAAGHRVIRVTNDAAQAHEFIVVDLAPGKTITDVGNWIERDLMKGAPPGKPLGGISGLAKGYSASVPLQFESGHHYGLICFAPDAKDGKSHFAHGMSKEFVVK